MVWIAVDGGIVSLVVMYVEFFSLGRNLFLLFFLEGINRVLRRRTEDTCAFFPSLLRDVAARGRLLPGTIYRRRGSEKDKRQTTGRRG